MVSFTSKISGTDPDFGPGQRFISALRGKRVCGAGYSGKAVPAVFLGIVSLAVGNGMFGKVLNSIVLLIVVGLTGCMKKPGPFETLEDYRRAFSSRKTSEIVLAGKVLTLQNAVEFALLNNPTNLAAAQAVLAAKYGYYRAVSAYAPEINVVSSVGHTLSQGRDLKNPPVGVMKRNDHLVTSGGIRAGYLLFDGFARELETMIARQEYDKSIAAGENVRRLLERAVAFAYFDMYLAAEEIVIYKEDLDFQNTALRQEEQRFRSGHVSKASVLNFQILAARAKSNISNARYRRQVAFHALAALMGCEVRQLEHLSLQKISLKDLPYIQDDIFYLELAISNRPDLKAEKMALNIAYRNRQKAIADFLPQIRLFTEYSQHFYKAEYGGYRVSDAHSNQGVFTYGVEGQWNIFRGFDSLNQLRQREVLEKIAMWGVNARFLEIVEEVRDSRANCANSRYQIELFQEMAQWVQEQRDLIFSEYTNGRETIARLNEAQNILVEAQRMLVVSVVEFNKSLAQLAAATGTNIK